MLWVLKRTISFFISFEYPKQNEKINRNLHLKFFATQDLSKFFVENIWHHLSKPVLS